jgi:hypothetical protein
MESIASTKIAVEISSALPPRILAFPTPLNIIRNCGVTAESAYKYLAFWVRCEWQTPLLISTHLGKLARFLYKLIQGWSHDAGWFNG